MLATRIRQKDGIFYFASCPAKEILSKVRFISRYYGEDEQIAAQTVPQNDEIAQFIARIERNDAAFQRVVSRAKVRSLKNFYETIGDKEAKNPVGEIKRHLRTFLDRFFGRSQFKRSAIPNAPKVGSGGSLSPRGDWRAPSDGESAAWLARLDLVPDRE